MTDSNSFPNVRTFRELLAVSDYEQALAGIPMWPADWSEIQSAIDREKALEATIDKIKGVGTMAELRAAGIYYELRTASWRVTIAGIQYDRSALSEIINIIGQKGLPDGNG